MKYITAKIIKFSYAIYIFIVLVVIWNLTKIWLPQDYLLTGHDSGLALDAKQFLLGRFYAWDDHVNFGQDNTLNLGSITLHSIDYFLSIIAGKLYAGNQIAIFFWIAIIFLSAFVLGLTLRKYLGKFFVYIFPIFITFNFYVFQSIFMLERAKYGLLAATMLFLSLAIRVLDKRISIPLAILLSSVIFLFFNGGGIWGLPLYGGIILQITILFCYIVVWDIRKRDFTDTRRLFIFLTLSLIGYLLINSYSIIPYFFKLKSGDYSLLFDQNVAASNRAWLDYISQSSSFINIFRLQGIPDWYNSSFIVNANHPYAEQYTTNTAYLIASFAFPVLAFMALLLAKIKHQRRWISLFALTSIISLIFVAGTHPPFGFIYAFLYENVPGFTIFRTPFYKFGSAFFLSTLILISYTLSRLINISIKKISNNTIKPILGLVFTTLIIIIWITYHKPLFSDKILYWQKDFTTRVILPEYIQKFKEWIGKENIDGRILLLPPIDEGWRVDKYDWGYWSLSTLPSMLIEDNTIANDATLRAEEKAWIWELYSNIGGTNEVDLEKLAIRLGIKYFLIRKDETSNITQGNNKTKNYEDIFSNYSNIEKIVEFDQWVFYKLKEKPIKKFYATSSLINLPLEELVLYRYFAQDKDLFLEKKKSTPVPREYFSRDFQRYACESCLIESMETRSNLPVVRILPNSPLYKLKKINEQMILSSNLSQQEKLNTFLGFVFRRAGEVKKMLDFGAREKYLVEDLRYMNDYLVTAYQLLELLPESKNSFQQAKQIMGILDPIEINFRIEIEKAKTGTYGETVIQGMTDVLWQIYRFKTFYGEILQDGDKWISEKLYTLDIDNSNFDNLYINVHTLPLDEEGNRIYPKDIILYQDSNKKILEYETLANDNLLKVVMPKQISGKLKLELSFPSLPNKFNLEKTSIEQTTNGAVSCVSGKIERFDQTRGYRIEITAAKTNQVLKLFIREDKEKNAKTTYFLRGEKEIPLYPLVSYEPFTYIYNPQNYFNYSTIFICSSNKEKPEINQIIVKEIFSPSAIVSKFGPKAQDYKLPVVEYQKINPTRYQVTIQNADQPFILVFNERYDPLWEAHEHSGEVLAKENHIIVNGYANGWIVKKKGNMVFAIEYYPQSIFYLSIAVSVIYGIVCITGIGWRFIKQRIQHDVL